MKPIPLFLLALMVLTVLGFGQISTAYAHDLEAGQISVLLKEDEAMVIVSPTADLFEFADEDQNGLLSVAEVAAHQAAIQTLVKEEVTLYDQDRVAADIVYVEAFVPDMESGDPNREDDFLQVFLNYQWETAPEIVDVQFNLFNSAGDEAAWIMKDERTNEVFEGAFTSDSSITRLRGEGTPTENSWGIWFSGVEHVLSGYDHILFILALVLATAGLRKLLIPLTAFTLAHTVTLAAVAFGFEPPVPAWFIEATIAASIAILAGIYLFGITADVWWITALLGLVHGLGFGQAMTASLGNLQQWGTTLIAITIGVELTHLAIAMVGAGALYLVREPKNALAVRRVISIAVFCIGLYWTLQRIPI